MLSTDNENNPIGRQLWTIIIAGTGVLLLIALVILWRYYRLPAVTHLLIAAGRTAAESLPLSLRDAAGEQAELMGLPLAVGSPAYWYLARAGGVVAYLLLWLATCWGIMMSSKVIKGVVEVPIAYALHEYLPILGVVFAVLHGAVLMGDTYIDFALWQLFVPFAAPYKPLWTGLGIIAFYLSVALIASHYLRKRIGQKTWRALHYTSYLAYLLALLHGVMAGSDSGSMIMRVLYVITGGLSVFLLIYRLLAYAPRPARATSSRSRPSAGD